MTRKLTAFAIAAVLSLSAAAPAVYAMSMEFNMLTGAVHNALSARGISTDGMSNLTLGQIAAIRSIVDDGDIPESNKKARIEAIIRNN